MSGPGAPLLLLYPRGRVPRPELERATIQCMRLVLEARAASSMNHNITIKARDVVPCLRERGVGDPSDLHHAITLAGRILSRYARPLRRAKPVTYRVTARLLEKLYGLSYTMLREKPVSHWSPIEHLYAILYILEEVDQPCPG